MVEDDPAIPFRQSRTPEEPDISWCEVARLVWPLALMALMVLAIGVAATVAIFSVVVSWP